MWREFVEAMAAVACHSHVQPQITQSLSLRPFPPCNFCLACLDDEGVARKEGGGQRVEDVVKGVVPGHDGPDNSQRVVFHAGGLVKHHAPRRPGFGREPGLALLDQPPQLFARRHDLAKGGVHPGLARVPAGDPAGWGGGGAGWGHPSPPRARPPLTRPPTNPSRSPADDVLVVDDELEQHTHEAAALRKCGRPPDSRSRPRGRDAVPHFGRRHRGRRAQRLQGGGVIVVYDARRWPHGRPVAGALPVVLELGW